MSNQGFLKQTFSHLVIFVDYFLHQVGTLTRKEVMYLYATSFCDFFSIFGGYVLSCVKSNVSIPVCTLRHVHHASLLLCVLSVFQRACFCAGTDDAAGRNMAIAGSTSTLAHLQEAWAPGSHIM